ncbi:glycoside hydrolase family 2 TIM barrel-domain containing protein [Bacteroides sp. AN502(2024)]|uniref:beta-glucuronidase LacZ4 n=1 Tax=Bacteroides sp. AN502(2024) TaxID=3160599 RepID=UPI003510D9F4
MKALFLHSNRWVSVVLFMFYGMSMFAQRQDILLNNDWRFRFSHQVQKGIEVRVDLPHTWNAQDALSGKIDYKRGIGNYEKDLFIRSEWKGKRLFIRFEGVNTIADVFINHRHIGEHRGGYGAFIFEITEKVEYGKENSIWVRVNNSEQLDIMPLVGDFNFYGGIYRDVHLLITDETCISPLDYASPGVRLIQDSVSHEYAKVRTVVDLSNGNSGNREVELNVRLLDGRRIVKEETKKVNLSGNAAMQQEFTFEIDQPHLWNGRQDPFLYQVEVTLSRNGRMADCVIQPLGLRFYRIVPDKGFFLNGKHLPLQGVCRHQDRSEVGNALRPQHHEEDVALMLEMGVNAVRLAHYPQGTYFYDLMDKNGIIVWAEIPFVGPGGYNDKGFVDSPAFRANGKEQLKELIRQHYNHPSICVWGLFNELTELGDNPVEYIKELNVLAHQEDPTRFTTSASNQMGDLNFITDAIAWNRYDGWYGGMPADLGRWLDRMHKDHPEIRIAISEYGAGASIYHQQDSVVKTVPASWWHPENWQTFYHIENWKTISSRPYVWGSFVWNMFDFGAAHRTEGDRPGINDKGLVTFDRKVRKDAFYFYKANWNREEPMLYLTGKRNTVRTQRLQTIIAFTNQAEAELFVNGKSYGKARPDSYAILEWENVELQPGENEIKVVSTNKKLSLSDSFHCRLCDVYLAYSVGLIL